MNLLTLALAGLRGAWLTHALNVGVLALGIGTVTLLLLFSAALSDRLVRDARGIDLVVGAKGSPLQLVLSAVFEADDPTGNIPFSELPVLAHDPLITRAVPLALGDAARGYRIVGTTPDYLSIYNASLASGQIWQHPMDAVLGAEAARGLGLQVGDRFAGAHGINGEGALHKATPYVVTGILSRSGAVLDRLVLTSVESVWQVHEGHGHAHGADEATRDAGREVTAVLLTAKTPLAQIMLPYRINRQTPYMAAVPSIEWGRLLSVLGFGMTAFRAMGVVLIVSAALGMLIALVARLRERRQEFAVMRLLGASRSQVFATVLIEALILVLLGCAAGVVLGHVAAWLLAGSVPAGAAVASMGAGLRASEWQLLGISLLVGVLAAFSPTVALYRGDVAEHLADRHA